jgi:hypothetical protein
VAIEIGPAQPSKFAVEVDAGHVLALRGALDRAGFRCDVAPGGRVDRIVADDVQRHAAVRARHGVAADDRAIRQAHGIDRIVVARVQRDVVHIDVGRVLAVLDVGVVVPAAAEQVELAVAADHEAALGAGRMHVDVRREDRRWPCRTGSW